MATSISIKSLASLFAACAMLAIQPALAACIPDAFPQNWLQAQEDAGGHTIDRHVNKTDQQLVDRLQNNPNIPAASTFTSRAVAENNITAGLAMHRAALNAWRQSAGVGARRAADFITGNNIGRVATRPPNLHNVQDATDFRTVLQATAGNNCLLLTSFPIP